MTALTCVSAKMWPVSAGEKKHGFYECVVYVTGMTRYIFLFAFLFYDLQLWGKSAMRSYQ